MRLFTALRFGVYAVIIAIGVLHLLPRGDAPAEEPRGPWASGQTSQGLTVDARVEDGRLDLVRMGWRGRCTDGQYLNDQRNHFTGYFERHGRRFSQRYDVLAVWNEGKHYYLEARVEGSTGERAASGTAWFTASYPARGGRVICVSGPIRWSAR